MSNALMNPQNTSSHTKSRRLLHSLAVAALCYFSTDCLPQSVLRLELAIPGGTPRIVVEGNGEGRVILESSQDLDSWNEVAEIHANTLPQTFSDTDGSELAAGFYRARLFPYEPTASTTELCGTMEAAEPLLLAIQEARSPGEGDACPIYGDPDSPEIRNAAIPEPSTPIKTIRLRLHVLANDDGSNPAAKEAQIAALEADLRRRFQPHRLAFEVSARVVPCSEFRHVSMDRVGAMKALVCEEPHQQLNVYVSDFIGGPYGRGTFPWDNSAIGVSGGILLNESWPEFGVTTLAHEVGHCLGLWHTHQGASPNANRCGPCSERADRLGADLTGDFCSDTPVAPRRWFGACGDRKSVV